MSNKPETKGSVVEAPERIRWQREHFACTNPACTAEHDAEYIRADLARVHQPDVQAADVREPSLVDLALQAADQLEFYAQSQGSYTPTADRQAKAIAFALRQCVKSAFAASPVQADEVSRALNDLREIFPNEPISIEFHDYSGINGCGGNGYVSVTGIPTRGVGATLSEAMQRVREWKE